MGNPRRQRPGVERRAEGRRRPRRSGWPWLLFYFAISLTGVFAFLLSASRRQRFERRWEDLGEFEPPQPEIPEERPHPAVPAVAREIPGPAGSLFVDDGGMVSNEAPVLFVHGLGGTSRQWRAQLGHLRAERRAVALDLRGHGDSEPAAEGRYGVADYAADVAAVADTLALDRFVLVGHSLGATVAIDYASHHPERVVGLLLVDPNGDQTQIPGQDIQPFLDSLAHDPRGEMQWYFKQILVGSEPEVADQVLADLELTDLAALPISLESSVRYSPLPALAAYPGPKLSLISEMNSLPYSLHNLVEDLPHELLCGTSHWLMMDRPEEFNRWLDEFVAIVG